MEPNSYLSVLSEVWEIISRSLSATVIPASNSFQHNHLHCPSSLLFCVTTVFCDWSLKETNLQSQWQLTWKLQQLSPVMGSRQNVCTPACRYTLSLACTLLGSLLPLITTCTLCRVQGGSLYTSTVYCMYVLQMTARHYVLVCHNSLLPIVQL